eukprot:CAMPEP_0174713286 /NCGR_PEP_ID=MMETSP1094-20130205/14012_1 /TAXON_ID=156173 /ORGANISM="Chrysochromulina brevifilum, Strain UTEX LB 985" /LENGTH=50 /DNA_ID=CAMNT_0015912455 /DNA_START=24 /DNA_END=173 /DNA_ORIENTATION=-
MIGEHGAHELVGGLRGRGGYLLYATQKAPDSCAARFGAGLLKIGGKRATD